MVERTVVSSCQQLRHGSDIMSTHVDLSMLDILFLKVRSHIHIYEFSLYF